MPGARTVSGSDGSWKRIPARRSDWEQVKLSWMVYLLRCKFFPADVDADAPPSQAQTTAAVLIKRAAAGEHWLPVEHTSNDSKWGDDSDGAGTNLLGRGTATLTSFWIGFGLDHFSLFTPFRACDAPPTYAVQHRHALRRYHADRLLTGACNPMLCPTFASLGIALVILEAAGIAPMAPLPLNAATVAATAATPSAELVRYHRGGSDTMASNSASASDAKKNGALDFVVVLDFEATCWDKTETTRSPQEIIEFPGLLVNVQTGELVAEFHEYVTPDVHPTISGFCTGLTGITQSMVDGGAPLNEVMARHMAWLASHGTV